MQKRGAGVPEVKIKAKIGIYFEQAKDFSKNFALSPHFLAEST